jgi:RNA 2',3'-cyclic 3'-phosphodiesterase
MYSGQPNRPRTSQARLFFAIWPDVESAQALHGLAIEQLGHCGGRVMRQETLHLTLAFLGEIATARLDEVAAVASRVSGAPFVLTLDRLAYWRHNRILWAGGDSPPLTALASELTAGLRSAGFALDPRPFATHLTLSRHANCTEVPSVARPITWPVREFVLVESRRSSAGAHYEVVGRWPLLG